MEDVKVNIDEVVVHPLVLLSIVDHYNRIAKDTKRRVVGVLLGENFNGKLDISNSFAVPFQEDLKDPNIWFMDIDFLENMTRMFLKISAKENIVGFYSTGPKIRENDLEIDAVFRKYCINPVLCIVDIRPEIEGSPIQSYYSLEKVDETSKETKRSFVHLPSSIEAYEAEEVGVEHLLRDINDPTTSALSGKISQKMTGLRGLKEKLQEMNKYLSNVAEGRLPMNNQVIYNMQDIINLLPNLNIDSLVKSFLIKTNDMHLVIYISSLVRSIIALHDLLDNKINHAESSSLQV